MNIIGKIAITVPHLVYLYYKNIVHYAWKKILAKYLVKNFSVTNKIFASFKSAKKIISFDTFKYYNERKIKKKRNV